MSYQRVIPRDLFNEANLLKCLGQLYLELERYGMEAALHPYDELSGWTISQNSADGSIQVDNIQFWVRGKLVKLTRPLNSRQPYPLWAYPDEETEIAVFTTAGKLSPMMVRFLKQGMP